MRSLEQLKVDNYIMIDTNWFHGSDPYINKYNHEALAILCFLIQNLTVRNRIGFSLSYLLDCINIKYNNYKAINRIKDVLLTFELEELLSYNTDINKVQLKDFIIADFNNSTLENFIMLYDFEIETIMNYKGKINKHMLLTVFTYIKSCIKSTTKICYPTVKTISKSTNISNDKTILKYIQTLKDLGLILYANAGTRIFEDGTVRECANTYTMNYEGHDTILQDKINEYINEIKEKNIELEKRVSANKKRSEAMKKYWAEMNGVNN